MEPREFFMHEAIQLPSRRELNKDFEEYISKRLDDYLDLIDELDTSAISEAVKNRKSDLQKCCDHLKQAVTAFLNARVKDAYGYFESAMTLIRNEISSAKVSIDGMQKDHLLKDNSRFMFRVRRTQSPRLDKDEIFHIPLKLRHLVGTQRYSIPGMPCLYLAGSIYTCWIEMGRPPFHEMQCSAFWVIADQQLKLLNLSWSPRYLALNGAEHVVGIVLWPLLFMCSIVVAHRASPFKPEYIIPQMLLQWVTQEQDFDGIIYFTTHIDSDEQGSITLPFSNIVIPAQKLPPSDDDKSSRQRIAWTNPHSWQLLDSFNSSSLKKPPSNLHSFTFCGINDNSVNYSFTKFAEIEGKLFGLMCKELGIKEDVN